MAGVRGIEPRSAGLESAALPLGYTPLAPQPGVEPGTSRLTAERVYQLSY